MQYYDLFSIKEVLHLMYVVYEKESKLLFSPMICKRRCGYTPHTCIAIQIMRLSRK